MELGLGLSTVIPFIIYVAAVFAVLLTLMWRIEVGIFFLVPFLPLQNLMDSLIQFPLGKDFLDILYLSLFIRWFYDRNISSGPRMIRKRLGYTLRYVKPVTKSPSLVDKVPLELIVFSIILWTFLELWPGSSFLGYGSPISLDDPRFITWKNFMMLPLLYFILVNNIKSKRHIQILLILMCLSMLFMDRNFYQNISGKDFSAYSDELRVAGTFTYLGPNELAVFYAQHTALLFGLFLTDKSNKRRLWLYGLTIFFNYFCLMFLFSRGGYLASLISWIFLGIIRDRRIAAVMILFLISWRLIVPVSVQQRIDMSTNDQHEVADRSIEQRYELWEFALRKISEYPLLGVGYNIVPHMNIYVDKARASIHNGYLEVTLEQGLIGLSIYLIFFMLAIRYGWLLYSRAEDQFFKGLGLGFIACILAILAGNIAGSYWFYLNVSGFYWVNLALVIASLRIVTAENKARKAAKNPMVPDPSSNGKTGKKALPLIESWLK